MRTLRAIAALLVSLCLLVPAGAQTTYRILVSNDDGVRAPGIAAVAQALQALGQVTIVAPAEGQSGKGHAITITEPIFREDLTLPNGLKAIGLTSTPVSAVKVALKNILKEKPDLVVSGINRGYNLGLSAYLSGTAGVAREAAMWGIPAIAASLAVPGTRDYTAAAEAVLFIAARVKANGLPPGVFLNVNIPPGDEYKGRLVTTQAMQHGGDESFAETTHPSGRTIYWNVYREGGGGLEGTDMWAVENGYVSITPLKVPEHDPAVGDRIKGWIQ